MIATSPTIKKYFKQINDQVKNSYAIAKKAREKGLDPEKEVPIPVANNMAERVVGLISVMAPQVNNSGIPERIIEFEKEFGLLDWRVGFRIAEEVAKEKFCKFKDKVEAMEIGIRVGFAYLTLGIVSAPLEGFIGLKIKKRKDGKEYFSLQYAGPIRAAGGTASSTSVILADYVRVKMGYAPWDPDELEINRYMIEVNDYHDRVTNLQYRPSDEELKFLISHLPVEVDGDPTERFEVSNYKDLPRIETNMIRGGVALVLAEGVSQKAPKLWKRLGKWGKDFGLEWDWIQDFLKIKEEVHSRHAGGKENKDDGKKSVKANNTYIMDLVAGRPILTHPLAEGGFRLRYGRNRTSGFSAACLHPATMVVLNKFVAIGTQLKVERPGKACTITVCDTLDGPIVRLEDQSVVYLDTEEKAKLHFSHVEEILFLGDILFNYGDFSENGHSLVPAGYCEEWWALEVDAKINLLYKENKFEKLSKLTNISQDKLNDLVNKPLLTKISWQEALTISQKLEVPLHPKYSYYWKSLSGKDLINLKDWLQQGKVKIDERGIKKIILPFYGNVAIHLIGKKVLERLGIPHQVINKENIVLEREEANCLASSLNFKDEKSLENITLNEENVKDKRGLEIINCLSNVTIRDKAGTFIGARMGRPEKAKMRHLKGSPQVMFPIGEEGDRLRSFQAALKVGKVNSYFPLFFCETCEKSMVYPSCEECGKECISKFHCRFCGDLEKESCSHGEGQPYKRFDLDINYYFNKAKERLKEKLHPDLIKGIRGTSNKNHIVEHLSKGILRAKHDIYVNKDGTTRYDCTELPLTHFKPKEIRTSVEKLKEIGYEKDIYGKELVDDNQILEMKPQDIILPGFGTLESSAPKVLSNVANFIDELLIKFYKMKPFYKIKTPEDLVGHLVIGLAPHISAGLVGRIIGFSETQGLITHPMYHAGLRRDCDGDEACVMLLMDALLNFSRQYLPERRGAKSITPDTLIYLRKNKKIMTEKIGTLIDSLLTLHQDKVRYDEDYEILDLNGYEAISFDATTQKVGFYPITKFIRHESPEEIYEVTSSHGKIKVTGDHSIFVTTGKKIIEKEVRNLKEGEFMVTLGKINLPKKKFKRLDLCKIASDIIYVQLNKEYTNKLSKKKKEILLNKWGNNVYRYLNGTRKSPFQFVLDSGVDFEGDSICCKKGSIMPRYLEVDKYLVRLISYLISEGYMRKKRSCEIVNTDLEILNEIKESLEHILQRKVQISWDCREGKKKCGRIRLPGILRDVLISLGIHPVRSNQKRLPPFLFLLSNELKEEFLRCYVNGDGHDYKHKNFKMLYSNSEYLAAEISLLAHSLGYKTSINKGTRCKQILYSKYNDTDSWWPLYDFTKELYGALRKEGFVKDEICKILANYRKNVRSKSASKFSIKKIMGLLKHQDNKHLRSKFNLIYQSDVKVERVRKIHKFKSLHKYVYDLEVPVHQNFLCGPHPIFAHNTMDAALVLTSTLNPNEVDDQVHGMDVVWKYPLEFYEASLEMKNPWEVKDSEGKKIEQLADRLGKENQFEDFGFTHHVDNFNKGVLCSSYKTLPSMAEKLFGQMDLAQKIRAVDMDDVAKLVIQKHFLKDIKGNFKKFSMQKFRCVKCNAKYRRPPLSSKCNECNGKLIFTISHGSVIKYLIPSLLLSEKYEFSPYLKHTLDLLKLNVDVVFGKEKDKQVGLGEFIG